MPSFIPLTLQNTKTQELLGALIDMNMIALDRAVGIVIDTCDRRAKWVGFEGPGPSG